MKSQKKIKFKKKLNLKKKSRKTHKKLKKLLKGGDETDYINVNTTDDNSSHNRNGYLLVGTNVNNNRLEREKEEKKRLEKLEREEKEREEKERLERLEREEKERLESERLKREKELKERLKRETEVKETEEKARLETEEKARLETEEKARLERKRLEKKLEGMSFDVKDLDSQKTNKFLNELNIFINKNCFFTDSVGQKVKLSQTPIIIINLTPFIQLKNKSHININDLFLNFNRPLKFIFGKDKFSNFLKLFKISGS